jgi:hypothetical protein
MSHPVGQIAWNGNTRVAMNLFLRSGKISEREGQKLTEKYLSKAPRYKSQWCMYSISSMVDQGNQFWILRGSRIL